MLFKEVLMLGKIISAAVLAAGAVTAGVIAKKKNSDFCPECDIKKAIAKAQLHTKSGESYNNGVALTPPMGWSSWNTFGPKINEKLIKETAMTMKDSGLLEAGYNYINLDDCWHSSMRDENGRLQGDLTTFPNGIKALVKELNELGFKVGIYSSNGTLTCEDLPASLGNERIDAETFAEWGIEYFKYDFCHNKAISGKAPLIEQIVISSKDGSVEKVLKPENANLFGTAAILHDSKGSYIGRLDNATGSVSFKVVNLPCDGEYIVTFIIKKSGDSEKFATVTVNSADEYELTAPPTKAWSRDARVQLYISFKKGDNIIEIRNPIGSKMDSAARQYINMGKELKRATKLYAEKNNIPEKPIVYSICEWGRNKPWRWGAQAGNLWRTTPDIKPIWASVIGIYEVNVRLYKYSGPGAWNDPDMLEVGNGKLTYEENKSHFTLWCMMAAPLILGNDIRKLIKPDGTADENNKTLQIVTNKDLIDIDRDPLGVQCRRFKTNLISDVLLKPLANGDTAVCFFNKTDLPTAVKVSLSQVVNQNYITMQNADEYKYTDLWTKEEKITKDEIACEVAPHGVAVFRVKPF
ncbi:MAG TPA: hypothetical protein DCR23_04410 [Ruminococcaceae bacterium]|nr:hypothetical protein [Oscillospiraceae bacterium]